VVLTSSVPDATIYYTTDGTNPRPSGNVYSGPIEVKESLTIRAMAVDRTRLRGPIASFPYVIDEEDARPSSLSLIARPASVVRGRSITLSGRLTSDGNPLAGQRIELHRRPAGIGEFERFGRVETSANGTFALTGVRPQRSTDYRAVFEGDGSDYEESISAVRRVRVRPPRRRINRNR
jgi:hypothetical protein